MFKKFFYVAICLVIALVLFPSASFAAAGINKQIPYQGVLKTASGVKATDGDYDMVFKIYNVATGGTALWTGTHTSANGNAVTVTEGVFSVMLGSGSGNTMTVDFNNDTLYLGVKVGSDSEMTPRKRIGASAYAFNADLLDGLDSLAFLRSDEADTISASSSSSILTITQSGTGDILNLFDGAVEVLTVLDGGNVGIGTMSPSYKLQVDAASTDGNIIATSFRNISNLSANTKVSISFAPDVTDNVKLIAGRYAAGATGGGSLDIQTKQTGTGVLTSRMFFDNSGNIGIGTAAPASTLHVSGTGWITGLTVVGDSGTETNNAIFGVKTTSRNALANVGDKNNYLLELTQDANNTGHGAGLAFRMSTDSSNVGAAIIHERVGGNSQGKLNFYTKQSVTVAVAPVLALTIDQVGSVGVGTAAPGLRFHVSHTGQAGAVARFTDDNGSCDIDPTNTALVCASDISLKKNVLTLDNSLEKVLALNPITFNWNGEEDDAGKHFGFVAQEVESIFPELVSTNEHGIKSLAYSNFAPILTKAIQEVASLGNAFKQTFIAWFADATNGITDFFAKKIYTEQICLKKSDGSEYCVNGDDLEAIIDQKLSTSLSTSNVNNDAEEDVVLPEPQPQESITEFFPTEIETAAATITEEVTEITEATYVGLTKSYIGGSNPTSTEPDISTSDSDSNQEVIIDFLPD